MSTPDYRSLLSDPQFTNTNASSGYSDWDQWYGYQNPHNSFWDSGWGYTHNSGFPGWDWGFNWNNDRGPIDTYPAPPPGGIGGIIGGELDTPKPDSGVMQPIFPPNHGIIQPTNGGGLFGSGVEFNLGGLIPIGSTIAGISSIISGGSGGGRMGPNPPVEAEKEQLPTVTVPPPAGMGPHQTNPPHNENLPEVNLPVVLPPTPPLPPPLGTPPPTTDSQDGDKINVPIPIGGQPTRGEPENKTVINSFLPYSGFAASAFGIPQQNVPGEAPAYTPPAAQPSQPQSVSIPNPDRRDLYDEANRSNDALRRIAPGALTNYADNSGKPGVSDMDNFMRLLGMGPGGNLGGYNSQLTEFANQQTIDSNRLLRQGNLADVGSMAGQALDARKAANPELYQMLGQYGSNAFEMLQRDMGRVNGGLTPEEIRNSQQAAREAYASRGRLGDNTAIAGEVLSRDAALRQREAQNRGYYNQSMQNAYGAIGAQTANAFDPFGAILGQQYGMQTSNVGNNNNLYQQGTNFSSGRNSNEYVQQLTNPLGAYPSDVYGSNFNMENARRIAEANNTAAMAGAKTASIGSLSNSILTSALPTLFSQLFNTKPAAPQPTGIPQWGTG
jgi:hypothetical protein